MNERNSFTCEKSVTFARKKSFLSAKLISYVVKRHRLRKVGGKLMDTTQSVTFKLEELQKISVRFVSFTYFKRRRLILHLFAYLTD